MELDFRAGFLESSLQKCIENNLHEQEAGEKSFLETQDPPVPINWRNSRHNPRHHVTPKSSLTPGLVQVRATENLPSMTTPTRLQTIFLAILLAVTLSAGEVCASFKGPGRLARKRLSSSVVQVSVYDWRGIFVRQGWGFFVNESGDIITIRSLLVGGSYVEVTTTKRETFVVDKVLNEDVDGNFILLGLENNPERFSYLTKSSPLPDVGDRILVGGGVGCEPGAFLDGFVEDIRKTPLYGYLIKIGSPFASLGSPIFNEVGVLQGIVVIRIEGGRSSAWAVPEGRMARVIGNRGLPLDFLTWAEKGKTNWDGTPLGNYLMGLVFFWDGRFDEAIPRLTKATKDPRFRKQAYFLLGSCNAAIGQYRSSIKAYEESYQMGDSSLGTLRALAIANLKCGELEKALDYTWEALRNRPNNYESYVLLSKIYNSMGRYESALSSTSMALKINAKGARALHQMGLSLIEMHRFKDAISAFKEAIKVDSKFKQAYWDLALTYYRKGDTRAAGEICTALEKVDPEMSRQLMSEVNP